MATRSSTIVAWCVAASPNTAGGASASSRCSRKGLSTPTGSQGSCGRRARWPSSRCSSSGRCSGTWTCSWARARSRSRFSRTGAPTVRRGSGYASRPRSQAATRTGESEKRPSSTQEAIAVASSSDIPGAPGNVRDARELFDLTGRLAVVTGGTRGLGLAMVRAFASAGAEVVVVSRKPDACDEVVAALRSEGLKVAGCACHVGHWDELEPLVERVYDDFGRIDILVNNAGISPLYSKLSEVSEELFDKVIGVNLKGPFRLAALIGERMVSAGGGSIINV